MLCLLISRYHWEPTYVFHTNHKAVGYKSQVTWRTCQVPNAATLHTSVCLLYYTGLLPPYILILQLKNGDYIYKKRTTLSVYVGLLPNKLKFYDIFFNTFVVYSSLNFVSPHLSAIFTLTFLVVILPFFYSLLPSTLSTQFINLCLLIRCYFISHYIWLHLLFRSNFSLYSSKFHPLPLLLSHFNFFLHFVTIPLFNFFHS